MAFDKTIAGRFRGNPNASRHNNVRVADFDNPGTPLQDDATIDTTAATAWEGINYTGKDGVEQYIPFSRVTYPEGAKENKTVLVADGAYALQEALLEVIGEHEVDPIITVSVTGADFTVQHIGSGTLGDLVLDGADQAFSRGAIS